MPQRQKEMHGSIWKRASAKSIMAKSIRLAVAENDEIEIEIERNNIMFRRQWAAVANAVLGNQSAENIIDENYRKWSEWMKYMKLNERNGMGSERNASNNLSKASFRISNERTDIMKNNGNRENRKQETSRSSRRNSISRLDDLANAEEMRQKQSERDIIVAF